MAILSIDTCLQACSAAILSESEVLSVRHELLAKGHAERLAPLVRDVLAGAALKVADLSRVVVTVGPGSFTGVRVGLGFARGLVIGHNIPVVGVTTLQALAAGVVAHANACRTVLIDARRGQVYGQMFAATSLDEISAPFVLSPEQARQHLEHNLSGRDLVLTGSGVPLVFSEKADDFDWQSQQPDPVTIARLGAELPVTQGPPRAFYLRPADAKPARPAFQ